MPHNKADNTKNKSEKINSSNETRSSYGTRRKRTPKKITPRYLHNSGLYYLERFATSKSHFKTVMLRKVKRSCMHHKDQNYDICAKMVDELANKFEACNLINDDVYANALATSLRRKGLSRRAAQIKMRNKGVQHDLATEVLKVLDAQYYETPEEAELAAALKLARKKKIGPYSIIEEPDNKKALGALARAGFSYSISQRIIDMKPEEVEETILLQQ